MSLPVNYAAEALDSVNNSTDVTGLLETLTGLVQNITNFLPTLLAQSQENNRALAGLCSYTQFATGNNYCSVGSNVVVPSILGMGIAIVVVLVVNVMDHYY